jgi:hypothetical protein
MKRSEVLGQLAGLLSTFDNSYPDNQQNRENAVTVLNLVESIGMQPPRNPDGKDYMFDYPDFSWESEEDDQLSFFDVDEL